MPKEVDKAYMNELVKKKCKICGKEFFTSRSNHFICSNSCRRKYKSKNESERRKRKRKEIKEFIENNKKNNNNYKKEKYLNTLCWMCRNATNSGCSWSEKLKPVEGWDAIKVEKADNFESYHIFNCPEFIRG